MSRSAYSRSGSADYTYVWLDDTSFVALMELSWLAVETESEPRWRRYREHCIQQILIGGMGVLSSGLDLLEGKSDRASLAIMIERLLAQTGQGGVKEVDNTTLCAELSARGHADVLNSLPDLDLKLASSLCSFIVKFLHMSDSEVARGIDPNEWWNIHAALYNLKPTSR